MRSQAKRLLPALSACIALAAGCGDVDETCSTSFPLSAQVEQWRKLVEKYFKYQHVTWALNIIKCESGGDPNAYNSSSGASGLFQHLKKYWPDRAAKAGFAGASPFDPEANIAASAYLLYAPGGGKSHWVCKYSPFEDFNYQPQYYKDGNPVGSSPPTQPPTQPPPSTSCPMLPQSGGILDDGGACFEKFGPSEYWRTVSGDGHGGGLHWTNATQQSAPSNWARWQIQLGVAGKYEVQYYAVPTYAMFSATRYVVRHAGQDQTVIVNQSSGGAGWRTLGTFDFAQGGGQHVAVYDDTSQPVGKDQHIVADAIRLLPAVDNPAPPPPKADEPPLSGADGGVEPPGSSRFDGGAEPPPTGPLPPEPVPPSASPNQPLPRGGLRGGCSVGAGAGGAWSLLPTLFLLALLRRRRTRCRAALGR